MTGIYSTDVINTPVWWAVWREAGTGHIYQPRTRRNGVLLDVPVEPADRDAFRLRHNYSPTLNPEANRVFLLRTFQLYVSGTIQHGDTVAPVNNSLVGAYPEQLYNAKIENQAPMLVVAAANFFCVTPRESLLMWDRANRCMAAFDTLQIPVRVATRHQLLLLSGSIQVGGVADTTPQVIDLAGGEAITATTAVHAIEVWV